MCCLVIGMNNHHTNRILDLDTDVSIVVSTRRGLTFELPSNQIHSRFHSDALEWIGCQSKPFSTTADDPDPNNVDRDQDPASADHRHCSTCPTEGHIQQQLSSLFNITSPPPSTTSTNTMTTVTTGFKPQGASNFAIAAPPPSSLSPNTTTTTVVKQQRSSIFNIAAPKLPTPAETKLAYLVNGATFFSVRVKVISISGIREFTNGSGAGCLVGFTVMDSTGMFGFFFISVNIINTLSLLQG